MERKRLWVCGGRAVWGSADLVVWWVSDEPGIRKVPFSLVYKLSHLRAN